MKLHIHDKSPLSTSCSVVERIRAELRREPRTTEVIYSTGGYVAYAAIASTYLHEKHVLDEIHLHFHREFRVTRSVSLLRSYLPTSGYLRITYYLNNLNTQVDSLF